MEVISAPAFFFINIINVAVLDGFFEVCSVSLAILAKYSVPGQNPEFLHLTIMIILQNDAMIFEWDVDVRSTVVESIGAKLYLPESSYSGF